MLVSTLIGAAAVSAQGSCVSTLTDQCTTPPEAYNEACACTGHDNSGAYFLVVVSRGSDCDWIAKDSSEQRCVFTVKVDENCTVDREFSTLTNIKDIICRGYEDTDNATPLP